MTVMKRCVVSNVYKRYNWEFSSSGLRVATLNKRLNIQRRLAWSLCKDDTHNRREAKPFFSLLTSRSQVYYCYIY